MQAGPIMQFPVFLVLFFAPVYVPLALLSGWIHAVATVNPLTRVLEAGRGFLAGTPTDGRRSCGAAFAATGFGFFRIPPPPARTFARSIRARPKPPGLNRRHLGAARGRAALDRDREVGAVGVRVAFFRLVTCETLKFIPLMLGKHGG
jgi:hypothetical protein